LKSFNLSVSVSCICKPTALCDRCRRLISEFARVIQIHQAKRHFFGKAKWLIESANLTFRDGAVTIESEYRKGAFEPVPNWAEVST
jgi:hypothetical protein